MADDDLDYFISYVKSEMVEPAESTYIRRCVRDFLSEMQDKRFAFSDEEASFETVADQDTYVPGQDDVPGNIRRIYRAWYLSGDVKQTIEVKTIGEIRAMQTAVSASSSRPQAICWWDNELLLYPAPTGGITIGFDYLIDATLDANSGNAFDDDPDAVGIGTFTNEFFTEKGRALMSAYVLVRWGLGRGRDSDLAAAQTNVYNKTLEKLDRELALKVVGDAVTPCNW